MVHLTAAVGPHCLNHAADVQAIQVLLNRTGAVTPTKHPLPVDRSPGPLTFAAILEFQTRWTSNRDGKIDPRGTTLPKLVEVATEFQLVVATVNGEAARSSAVAWKAILCVMKNRVGKREWSRFTTLSGIVKHTGFDAYTQKNAPYVHASHYMDTRSARNENAGLESLIATLKPLYQGTEGDITSGAVLYYSPKAQETLHKKLPDQYAEKPKWNFTVLKEVTVAGLLASDDFKFYAYK